MTPQQVLNHYAGKPGTPSRVALTATAIKCTRQAIYKWLRDGTVPRSRQLEIQEDTGGKLKADRK